MKDFWNNRYSEEGLAYGASPNDFLVKNVHLLKKGGEVLCIAEGEGRNAIFLARNGFKVTAVDFSEIGIRKIRERASEDRLEINAIVADLHDFEMDENKWDGIISIFTHLPSPLRKSVHQRIQAALNKDGLLILEAYRPEQLLLGTGGPKDKEMFMNLKILHDELPSLSPLFETETEREIHEGKYHNGTSSVVQFIGRKQSE